MRTAINLDDAVLEDAKHRAVDLGISLSQFVERARSSPCCVSRLHGGRASAGRGGGWRRSRALAGVVATVPSVAAMLSR